MTAQPRKIERQDAIEPWEHISAPLARVLAQAKAAMDKRQREGSPDAGKA